MHSAPTIAAGRDIYAEAEAAFELDGLTECNRAGFVRVTVAIDRVFNRIDPRWQGPVQPPRVWPRDPNTPSLNRKAS